MREPLASMLMALTLLESEHATTRARGKTVIERGAFRLENLIDDATSASM